jgi:hypothetical protein
MVLFCSSVSLYTQCEHLGRQRTSIQSIHLKNQSHPSRPVHCSLDISQLLLRVSSVPSFSVFVAGSISPAGK